MQQLIQKNGTNTFIKGLAEAKGKLVMDEGHRKGIARALKKSLPAAPDDLLQKLAYLHYNLRKLLTEELNN